MISYEDALKLAENCEYIMNDDHEKYVLRAWIKAGLVEPKKKNALEEAREYFYGHDLDNVTSFMFSVMFNELKDKYEKAIEEILEGKK